MSYSIRKAALIADQLERLATQRVHQLAGQLANLDFWLAEAAAAIDITEDYPNRFRRLRDAQLQWVDAHGTRILEWCPYCGGPCEFGPQKPETPRRTPTEELAQARQAVQRGMRRFLLRLFRANLLDEAAVRRACERVDMPVEPEDFEQ